MAPALAQGFTQALGDHPDHIHGRRCQELLEVRAHQAKVSTPAEIKSAHALREAALDPRPEGILGFECCRLLALARRLDRFMMGLRPDGGWRGAALAEVHAWRVGQLRQVAPSNRMRMTGSPETSCPGRQWMLACPWGQCACRASQSKTKACKS
jgi:hypothetical protein